MANVKCNICNGSFTALKLLSDHVNAKHRGSFICGLDECTMVIRSAAIYDNHCREYHSPAPLPFPCQIGRCRVRLGDEFELTRHLRGFHTEIDLAVALVRCGISGELLEELTAENAGD